MERVDAELRAGRRRPTPPRPRSTPATSGCSTRLLDGGGRRRPAGRGGQPQPVRRGLGAGPAPPQPARRRGSASRCWRAWPRRRPGRPGARPAACSCTRRWSPTTTSPPASPTCRAGSTRTPAPRTSCAPCSPRARLAARGRPSGPASGLPCTPGRTSSTTPRRSQDRDPSGPTVDPDAPSPTSPTPTSRGPPTGPGSPEHLATDRPAERRRGGHDRRRGRGRRPRPARAPARWRSTSTGRPAARLLGPGGRGDGGRAGPTWRSWPTRRQDRPRGRPRGVRGGRLRPLGGGLHPRARRARRRRRPRRPARRGGGGPALELPLRHPGRRRAGRAGRRQRGRAQAGARRRSPPAVGSSATSRRPACPTTSCSSSRAPTTRSAATSSPTPTWTPSCSPAPRDGPPVPRVEAVAAPAGRDQRQERHGRHPTADLDLAIRDLVRSAFGHAGQKCSAASLAIVEAPLYDDPASAAAWPTPSAALRSGRRRPRHRWWRRSSTRPTGAGPGAHRPRPGRGWLVEPRPGRRRGRRGRPASGWGCARLVVPPHRVLRAGARRRCGPTTSTTPSPCRTPSTSG